MQFKKLHPSIYKIYSIACLAHHQYEIAKKRQKLLGNWELLKAKGVSDTDIIQRELCNPAELTDDLLFLL